MILQMRDKRGKARPSFLCPGPLSPAKSSRNFTISRLPVTQKLPQKTDRSYLPHRQKRSYSRAVRSAHASHATPATIQPVVDHPGFRQPAFPPSAAGSTLIPTSAAGPHSAKKMNQAAFQILFTNARYPGSRNVEGDIPSPATPSLLKAYAHLSRTASQSPIGSTTFPLVFDIFLAVCIPHQRVDVHRDKAHGSQRRSRATVRHFNVRRNQRPA